MYIIIALIFTTKDHYVKLSFQWSDGGVQFVYWVQTFMTIKRYSVEKIIITKKFQATVDLLCWAALAHRPGKWSPLVLPTWMASRLHTSHRNAISWTPNYSFAKFIPSFTTFFFLRETQAISESWCAEHKDQSYGRRSLFHFLCYLLCVLMTC